MIVSRWLANTGGATAIEYALIASIVSIVIFGAVQTIGTTLINFFNSVAASV